jgi:hypothetical protein
MPIPDFKNSVKTENEYWFIGFNEKTRKYRLIDRYTTDTLKDAKDEFKTRNRFKKGWVYTIATSKNKYML